MHTKWCLIRMIHIVYKHIDDGDGRRQWWRWWWWRRIDVKRFNCSAIVLKGSYCYGWFLRVFSVSIHPYPGEDWMGFPPPPSRFVTVRLAWKRHIVNTWCYTSNLSSTVKWFLFWGVIICDALQTMGGIVDLEIFPSWEFLIFAKRGTLGRLMPIYWCVWAWCIMIISIIYKFIFASTWHF